MRRLLSYWQELLFIFANSADPSTCISLLSNSAKFHLANWLGQQKTSLPFNVRLKIAPHYISELSLRTFSGDLFVLFEVISGKVYFIPEIKLSYNKVRVILDCGANIGISSLYFAARYPNAKIYSIEPDLDNFSLLSSNTRSEPRITPIHAAIVGLPRESVRLTTTRQSWSNKIIENGSGKDVPAITVQEICDRYKLSQIDLLKMDVEGAEREIFRHGEFLERVSFVIAELHDNYSEAEFGADMAAHGLVGGFAGTLPEIQMTIASRAN
jgi:FkbM family methyltransferase